jgi:lipid-A-disaccharide synthase
LQQRGVNAPYFGHPALDRYESDSSTSQSVGLVLAPGSRRSELERLVPVFAATAERLGQIPLWIRPSSWTETQYRVLLRGILNAEPRGTIVQGMGSAKGARLALVASGTATLELGILGIPMVVAYRVDPLSFAIAKRLVTVKHVSLVNLVLGRGAVTEHLQESCNPENLMRELQKINAEGPERAQMLDDLAEFRSMLGDSGAMDRIAHYVLTL